MQARSIAKQTQKVTPSKPAADKSKQSQEPAQENYFFPSDAPIQTKLVVGSPNDKYEREADAVADQIMRMPARSMSSRTYSHSFNQVQTKCKACEKDDEIIRRMPIAEVEEVVKSGDNITAQRKATPQGAVANQAASSDRLANTNQLRQGGSPLPSQTRQFYESRFNRDLSHVRIHTGNTSSTFNQQIHAYAFTYANHIWMGSGKGTSPSHLLAHELTHVIQQTQPGTLSNNDAVNIDRADNKIQRFLPYWEPFKFNGTKNHALVLPEIGAASNIFTEAPVANANKVSTQHGNKGFADLYKASRTVGVFFESHHLPAKLPSGRQLKFAGKRYSHLRESAPRGHDDGTVTRVDKAPSSIKVGDLKPSHGTIEALEGPSQLLNYRKGYELAQGEINEMAALNSPFIKPKGKTWNLTTDILTSGDVTIPPKYSYSSGSGQASQPLIIKHNGRKFSPTQRVMGKIYVKSDPTNKGIWNYTWIPDTTLTLNSLPPRIRKLRAEVNSSLIKPIMESPVQKIPKRKPGLAKTDGPQLTSDHSGTVRRVAKDPFDKASLSLWNKNHKKLTKKFKQTSKTKEFERAEEAELAIKAQDAIRSKAGFKVPQASPAERKNVRVLKEIRFWTGLNSKPFGLFRRVFGRTFLKIAAAYQKIKTRFRERLKNRKKSFSSGLPGAALKAAFNVIKIAGSFIVQQTMARLVSSLKTGVSAKLKELIEPAKIEDLQAKVAEIKAMKKDMQARATDTAESIMNSALGPYMKHLESLDKLRKIVTSVTRLVNLVKWGARAVACLSPPAVGCLWIVGQALLESIAAKVVDTCWFKKKITPVIAKLGFVSRLPAKLAGIIIKTITGFLPKGLHGIFAKIDTSPVNVKPSDLNCNDQGSKYAISKDQKAIMDLQVRLGEKRFVAYMELMVRHGVSTGRKLKATEIRQIGDAVMRSGISGKQMQQLAKQPASSSSNKMPVNLQTLIDSLKKKRQQRPLLL